MFLLLILFFTCALSFGQTLTIGDIYDYQMGDEFIIRRDATGPPTYKYSKILQRTNFNTDSVRYLYNTQFITLDLKDFIWKAKDSTYSLTYTDLTLPYFKNFPNNDSIRYDTLGHDSGVYYFVHFRQKDSTRFDSCGALINQQYYFDGAIQSEWYITTTYAIKGIGVFEDYSYGPGNVHKDNVLYYKKVNTICGNKSGLPLSIQSVQKNSLVIYPNPVRDIIKMNGISECFFTIWNSSGESVMEGNNKEGYNINVSEFKPGIYTIRTQTENRIFTTIFIKE